MSRQECVLKLDLAGLVLEEWNAAGRPQYGRMNKSSIEKVTCNFVQLTEESTHEIGERIDILRINTLFCNASE